MSDWTETTKGGWDVDMTEAARIRCPTANNRFWMPRASEKTIVFLTEQPSIAFWEHAMKIGKNFRNFATCLSHMKIECILCALEDKIQKYKAVPFTIIDRSSYTLKSGDKAGTTVKDTKRLYVLKSSTWEKVARKAKKLQEEGKSLRFAEFKVFRSKDPKSPSTGDDFEFIRMVSPKEFEDSTEFDYKTLFEPNPELVAKYLLQMKSLAGISGGEEDDEGEVEGVKTSPF